VVTLSITDHGQDQGLSFQVRFSATERNAAVTVHLTLFSWPLSLCRKLQSHHLGLSSQKPDLFWGNHCYIATIPSQGREQSVNSLFFKTKATLLQPYLMGATSWAVIFWGLDDVFLWH